MSQDLNSKLVEMKQNGKEKEDEKAQQQCQPTPSLDHAASRLVKMSNLFLFYVLQQQKSGHPTPFCIPLVSLSELHSYTI